MTKSSPTSSSHFKTSYGFTNRSLMSLVGVILVNWNGGEFTIPCICSLLAGSVKPNLIVIVDNGSTDGSPHQIGLAFPDVILIRNRVNKGFAEANNQGIELLLERGMDYIWILNNDTVVAEDCLARLIQAAKDNPHAACYSAKIFYMKPPDRLWYGGGYRHHLHLGVKHVLDTRLDRFVDNGVIEVDFISGCCMMIPQSTFHKHGGFRAEYIAYSEDNEWCWRVKKSKERLLYVPGAVIWHHVSASARNNWGKANLSSRAWYLLSRNSLWTIRHHAESMPKKILAVIFYVGLAFKVMWINVTKGNKGLIHSLSKGIWHGLTISLSKQYPLFGIKNHN